MQVSWAIRKKTPEEYEKDKVGKYAPYSKDNTILPVPELVAETEPKTLSLIVTDLRTWRPARLKKETFGELIKTVGIPGRYYCWQSFTTWDVLLPSEKLAVKLARSNISTKNFWLQLEYQWTRQIRVTMCNIPVQLNGDVLAAYLSKYGSVEEVIPVRATDRTAHGDNILNICLDREGIQVILHIIAYKDQQMIVDVEGRMPLCWSCK